MAASLQGATSIPLVGKTSLGQTETELSSAANIRNPARMF